jgi:hypothetical protein
VTKPQKTLKSLLTEALTLLTSEPTPARMTTEQAGRYIGLDKRTLDNLRVSGGGPRYQKMGVHVYYTRAELDAWVEAQPVFRHTAEESQRKAG